MKPLIAHLVSISERCNLLAPNLFTGVPHSKIKQFAAEAKTLDAARMREMLFRKRYTLAAALLCVQSAQVLDDLDEMLIKRMLAIHQKGNEALQQYHLEHQARTDALADRLRSLAGTYFPSKLGVNYTNARNAPSLISPQEADYYNQLSDPETGHL